MTAQHERPDTTTQSTQAVLRQMVDRLADGIVVVASDGRIRFANPAAERLFGRSAAELEGEEFGAPLAADDTEMEIVRRGGGVTVAELRLVESEWEGEPATLVSLRDVTERREREKQLERERAARAEAEAANNAKSEFLAMMSHELRTPLNAVIGYAELLDLDIGGALNAEQRNQVERIARSARHLLGLVNQILDYAKVEAGRMSVHSATVSASDVMQAAVVLSQPLAEARGVRLIADPLATDLSLVGDRDRVYQVLTNLLANAVKFTEPGGEVRLSARRASEGNAQLQGGPWIAISVKDTGVGIAKELLDAIFSPFVQGDRGHTRQQDGTGLGLTISRRLARLMRGDLSVQSAPGRGSTFTLWLPESKRGPDSGEAPAVPRPADAVEVHSAEVDVVPAPAIMRAPGKARASDFLLLESDAIVCAVVARLRHELDPAPPASLRDAELGDHVSALIACIASAISAVFEEGETPSTLLDDTADIQRFIADRHGLQRARLGWTRPMLDRECQILTAEVTRALRRRESDELRGPQLQEALVVIKRYLDQASRTAQRALARGTLSRGDAG